MLAKPLPPSHATDPPLEDQPLCRRVVVGSRVRATVTTAIYRTGERGIVYHVALRSDSTHEYNILFARGGHEHFSAQDLVTHIEILDHTDPRLIRYHFTHLGVLLNDYRRRLFQFDWA